MDRRGRNILHNINSGQKYPESSENIFAEIIINVDKSLV